MPRIHNVVADALANAVARMTLLRDRFIVEILYKSSFLDNITNLRVFDDDE